MTEATKDTKKELLALLQEKERRLKYNKLAYTFPETGKFRRELYKKHVEFMNAGAKYLQRAMIAANRSGKSYMGGYEIALHATGLYPDWWQGKRFDEPVNIWCLGRTSKSTRDVIQNILLGKPGDYGSGMIPKDRIVKTTPKAGIADAVDDIWVKHESGGISVIGLRSYDQDVRSLMGVTLHVAWMDEEPPEMTYTEVLTRVMTVEGIVFCTFTPLEGLSKVVLRFMPQGIIPSEPQENKYIVQVSWDEVPHLSDSYKKKFLDELPIHERLARSEGVPQLGSGQIYCYNEKEYTVDEFDIPRHWPRIYGMDVGWNRTAAVWIAVDREDQCLYVYSEHYLGRAEPVIHAEAIRSRGEWIPGEIDPAARGRGSAGGEQLLYLYRQQGLNLREAENGVEAGILRVQMLFATQKIKIFKKCQSLLAEIRVYRRDMKGDIVKEDDHAVDALRYGVMGIHHAITRPFDQEDFKDYWESAMGKSKVGGY